MTQPNFTPGPWTVELRDCVRSIESPAGTLMHDETYYPMTPGKLEDWNLIAAAPDLYNVAVYVRDNCDTDGVLQGLLDKALAKAGRA